MSEALRLGQQFMFGRLDVERGSSGPGDCMWLSPLLMRSIRNAASLGCVVDAHSKRCLWTLSDEKKKPLLIDRLALSMGCEFTR